MHNNLTVYLKYIFKNLEQFIFDFLNYFEFFIFLLMREIKFISDYFSSFFTRNFYTQSVKIFQSCENDH